MPKWHRILSPWPSRSTPSSKSHQIVYQALQVVESNLGRKRLVPSAITFIYSYFVSRVHSRIDPRNIWYVTGLTCVVRSTISVITAWYSLFSDERHAHNSPHKLTLTDSYGSSITIHATWSQNSVHTYEYILSTRTDAPIPWAESSAWADVRLQISRVASVYLYVRVLVHS